MNHQLSSASRLVATALLVGVAVLACGRPNGATDNPAAASTPAAQQSQADQTTPTQAPTPIDEVTTAPTPGDAAASPVAPATFSGAAVTPDPLDTQISNLDSLLNGVNGSLSGSDNSGGE